MTIGLYENFPETTHKTAHFITKISNKRLQQTIIQTLHKLNTQTFGIKEISEPSIPECTLAFEFGIADSSSFTFLDDDEKQKILKVIATQPFSLMDFLCRIRYYIMTNEKKKPLKFDYYMIRFSFDKNTLEMRFFHERGPQHLSPSDITNLFARTINQISSKTILKAF